MGERFYRECQPDAVIHGQLYGIDFAERTITFHYEGDLPPLAKGRFAIVPHKDWEIAQMRLRAQPPRNSDEG